MPHGSSDVLRLRPGQGQPAGKIEPAACNAFGHRTAHLVYEVLSAEHRLFVHRPEERARTDTFFPQAPHGVFGVKRQVFMQHKAVDPVDVLGVGGPSREAFQCRQIAQEHVLPGADLAFFGGRKQWGGYYDAKREREARYREMMYAHLRELREQTGLGALQLMRDLDHTS